MDGPRVEGCGVTAEPYLCADCGQALAVRATLLLDGVGPLVWHIQEDAWMRERGTLRWVRNWRRTDAGREVRHAGRQPAEDVPWRPVVSFTRTVIVPTGTVLVCRCGKDVVLPG